MELTVLMKTIRKKGLVYEHVMDVAFALLVSCFVQLLYIPLIVLYYSLYVCVPLCVCVCVCMCVCLYIHCGSGAAP